MGVLEALSVQRNYVGLADVFSKAERFHYADRDPPRPSFVVTRGPPFLPVTFDRPFCRWCN